MKKKHLKKRVEALIITSINKPNKAVNKFIKLCFKKKINFIFVGDKKTPKFINNKLEYLDLISQSKLSFSYAKIAPINSYSRKNIGYIYAISKGAEKIYESDDDNIPNKNFFSQKINKFRLFEIKGKGFINIYKYFLKDNKNIIWPRGLPLGKIYNNEKLNFVFFKKKKINFSIIQRLCNGNPDVDAIYRLINNKININFPSGKGFFANNKSYIPFNSQNTVWDQSVFPLMYLPTYCTMRSTDIWRLYITTYIMNKTNMRILFTSPTAFQKRNPHNLLNDFKHEVPVYKDVEKLIDILKKVKIRKSKKYMLINLLNCYKKLVEYRFIHKNELNLVKSWCKDISILSPQLVKI